MLIQTLIFRCHYPGCDAVKETKERISVGSRLPEPTLPCGWQAVEGEVIGGAHYCPKHTYNPDIYDYQKVAR